MDDGQVLALLIILCIGVLFLLFVITKFLSDIELLKERVPKLENEASKMK